MIEADYRTMYLLCDLRGISPRPQRLKAFLPHHQNDAEKTNRQYKASPLANRKPAPEQNFPAQVPA
jgi:hypothetical protein